MSDNKNITSAQYISAMVKIQNAVKGVKIKSGTREERLNQIRLIFARFK